DAGAREDDRLEEIARRADAADLRQVRTDLPTFRSNAMAGSTAGLETEENASALRSVTTWKGSFEFIEPGLLLGRAGIQSIKERSGRNSDGGREGFQEPLQALPRKPGAGRRFFERCQELHSQRFVRQSFEGVQEITRFHRSQSRKVACCQGGELISIQVCR